jgi:hypothetical protein
VDYQLAHLWNLVIIAWNSLPPCVSPGKPCPGSTAAFEFPFV